VGGVLVVGLGGFLGTVARYGLTGLVHRHYKGLLPAGTLAVNVLGCLAIGAVMGLVEDRALLTPDARRFLVVGFLGGFTTFSALGHETLELLRNGQAAWAIGNAAANMVLGVGAVLLGRAAVQLL
jgi:CrcB protein